MRKFTLFLILSLVICMAVYAKRTSYNEENISVVKLKQVEHIARYDTVTTDDYGPYDVGSDTLENTLTNGAATVFGIWVRGGAAASYILFYDGPGVTEEGKSATDFVMDIPVGTANSGTYLEFEKGIPFSKDVGITVSDTNTECTIFYGN